MSTIQLTEGISLFSGTMFDYNAPEKSNVTIDDIAHALSHVCRFAGHVRHFYSVAQHAVNASYLVPAEHAYAALMHDTAEAFTNDLPTPLKIAFPVFKELEVRIETAMAEKFGFEFPLHDTIKYADLQMLLLEKEELKGDFSNWAVLNGVERPNNKMISMLEMSSTEAKRRFLHRFEELSAPEFDAILSGWSMTEQGNLRGAIWRDRKGRFENGTVVRTSRVTKIERGIALTNSGTRYKLELQDAAA